jgi:hypothetical protein
MKIEGKRSVPRALKRNRPHPCRDCAH